MEGIQLPNDEPLVAAQKAIIAALSRMRDDLEAVRVEWQPRRPRDPSEPEKLGDMNVSHAVEYMRRLVRAADCARNKMDDVSQTAGVEELIESGDLDESLRMFLDLAGKV